MTPRSSRRATTLLTTLAFIGLGLVLVLTLASGSLSELQKGQSRSHALRAMRAAESVLALATERMVSLPDFPNAVNQTLEYQGIDSTGRLTFDQTQADAWGIPASVNNRLGVKAIPGYNGMKLPAKAVHFVAVGESGGVKRTIDSVISIPQFPYALASTGPIVSDGGLLIGGLPSDDPADLDLTDLGPADLLSNADGEAVKLDGEVEITGDIKTVGHATLGPKVTVHGKVEAGTDPVELSTVDLAKLKPKFSYPLTPGPGHTKITGPVHYNSPNLELSHGLEMDRAILYVNGDLTIHGGLTGQGALLVNGKVEIDGGAVLSGENQLAIVAKDDVVVHGSGDSSLFQGLIYTEGDLIAENITLLGTFVANHPRSSVDPGSRLQLSNANVVYKQEAASFEFSDEHFSWFYGDVGAGNGRLYYLTLPGEDFNLLKDLLKNKKYGDPDWEAAVDSIAGAAKLQSVPVAGGKVTETDKTKWAVEPPNMIHDRVIPDMDSVAGFKTVHQGGGVPQKKKVTYGEETIGFSFDINEFISPENKVRVLSWNASSY